MTSYPADHWEALGSWVASARKKAGYADTKSWAQRVGRSTRVVLGLERGEPQGAKTVEAVAAALGEPPAQLFTILEEGRSAEDLAREETPTPTIEDLSRLPGQLQELQARVDSLEERLDALEHPGLHAVKAARTGERQPQEQSHSDHDGIDAPGHPDGA